MFLGTPAPSSGGSGVVSFDGSGDYLEVASSADFLFGNNDFTIEAFIYRPENRFMCLFDHMMGTGNFTIFSYSNGPIQVYNNQFLTSGVNPGNNVWFHLAIVRISGTLHFYINGIKAAQTQPYNFNVAEAGIIIGRTGYSEFATQSISNLRIIKGTAIYTSNFTPPTSDLTVITNTVLLCCQDPNSVTTEATGKTITSYGNPQSSSNGPFS